MEIQAEKRERTFIKLFVGGLVALFLIIAAGYAGLNAFQRWQEGHLIRAAAAHLTGGDTKAAALSARRAFQKNPHSAEAARILAQIADREGDRAAVDWWRTVIALKPAETPDILGLVHSALAAEDLVTAEKALSMLDNAAKQGAEFHVASARLAEKKGNLDLAEIHWQKATETAPDNVSSRLQLASTRLRMNDHSKRKTALEALAQLRVEPKERAAATRALILDGLAHRENADNVLLLARELQNYPEARFDDRLLYLDVLRSGQSPAFKEYLLKLQGEAVSKPADLASLFSWMGENETAAEAVEFAKTLPPESWSKWPVSPALATVYANLKDWASLEQLTRTTEWSPFDFLRHAYLARALRGQGKTLPAEQEWVSAQKEASMQPQSLLILARTVTAWGWDEEKIALLWLLTKNEDTKLAALQMLYQHYGKLGDTAGLYRALLRLVETKPNDLALRNNLAQISLLLHTDIDRASKSATEITAMEPSSGAFASTHAFSLYVNGDITGALQVMDQLSPEQLRDPSVATYYGVFLAAAGQKEKARKYLGYAEQANLLPEEKALVTRARNTLEQPSDAVVPQ